MTEGPTVEAEFYVAVLRKELTEANDERWMLRALLAQAKAQLNALGGEHAEAAADLERRRAAEEPPTVYDVD